jgi:uncharacterized membrane protein
MSGPDIFAVPARERLLVFVTLFVSIGGGFTLGFAQAPGATAELLGIIPVAGVAAGKFLPLWGLTGRSHFEPWHLGLVIGLMDTVTVLVLVYGLGALTRIDVLRRGLERVRGQADVIVAAYPSMRRAALVGVVLLVLFPVTGTGAIAATFVGTLLGLGRFELIGAVCLGGIGGGLLMAFAATRFAALVFTLEAITQSPTVKYAVLAGLAFVAFVAITWLNRAYRRALEAGRAARPPQPAGGGNP